MMLWNVQMKWKRKLALMGVFSLVLITMAFAITRVTVTCEYSGQYEVSWMYMWTSIEQNIGAFPRMKGVCPFDPVLSSWFVG